MRTLAVDTWGFLELELGGPQAAAVADALAQADYAFTTRDVVVETFNFLCRRTRSAQLAWDWWTAFRGATIRTIETPLEELHRFVGSQKRNGRLSLTDYSLAHAARQEGAVDIVTGDGEFRTLRLNPLFA